MGTYRTERITNISELEAILEKISILSQLAENSSNVEVIKEITKSIKESAQKAREFEFRIESRIIHYEPTIREALLDDIKNCHS